MTQLDLFSDRQRHRRWLERLVIPRFERQSGGVKRLARTAAIKHLLRVIESHQGNGRPCVLKVSTISHEIGASARTVERYIRDASELGFLDVTNTSGAANQYAINWVAIGEAILADHKTASLIDQSGRYNATPVYLAQTPVNLAQTPVNLAQVDAQHTSLTRARLNHELNHEIKPSFKHDGFENYGENKIARAQAHATSFSGWPFLIRREDLGKPSRVQQLWEHALEKKWCQYEHRVNFFVTAIWMNGQTWINNHGGKFTSQIRDSVKTGQWPSGTNDQEKRAIAAIQKLDREKVGQ